MVTSAGQSMSNEKGHQPWESPILKMGKGLIIQPESMKRTRRMWNCGNTGSDEFQKKSVFICLGCHNKVPQTGWLKQ